MCTGKCTKCIGCTLIPFSIICIACNSFLFFPGWSTEPAQDAGIKLTTEVNMFLGIAGGGFAVLIPAIQMVASGSKGYCGNRCGMLVSFLGAAVALCGSLFCLTMSAVAIHRGPVCQYYAPNDAHALNTPRPTTNSSLIWGRPFDNARFGDNKENYIFHKEVWDICVAPPNVVEFNVILFSILLAASSIEVLLSAFQLFNGLFGLICGTCRNKDDDCEHIVKDDEKKEYIC